MGGMASKEQLEAQVFSDPACENSVAVQALLHSYRAGDCTLDEAVLHMVLLLARENRVLLEQCVRLTAMQPAVYYLPPGVGPPAGR